MNEEETFENKDELQAWLVFHKGVPEDKAAMAAETLFDREFDSPSSLMGISSSNLQTCGLAIPLAQLLSNKLEKQQHPNAILKVCAEMGRLCSCEPYDCIRLHTELSFHHSPFPILANDEDGIAEMVEFVRKQKRQADTLMFSSIRTEAYNDTMQRVGL
eukprot:scaffold8532_cov65-Attheya_sp.AAC.1